MKLPAHDPIMILPGPAPAYYIFEELRAKKRVRGSWDFIVEYTEKKYPEIEWEESRFIEDYLSSRCGKFSIIRSRSVFALIKEFKEPLLESLGFSRDVKIPNEELITLDSLKGFRRQAYIASLHHKYGSKKELTPGLNEIG